MESHVFPSSDATSDRVVAPSTRRDPTARREAPGDGVLRQRISVEYRYDVHFTRDVFAPGNRTLVDVVTREPSVGPARVSVVVEAQVAACFPPLLDAARTYAAVHAATLTLAGDPLVERGGEEAKNDPALVPRLQRAFHDAALDRHAYVVCVGGGALQDAVGYAAATTHRGVRLVRLPTTVLAQNDSGVGVKNAINAFAKKNFLGTFAPPFAVVNDARFLERLPLREVVAGMSEAVKVALIRDAAFFAWLTRHADALAAGAAEPLGYLIRRCAELHLRHIGTSGDPFEFGSARPLDFGHWAAHKLESMTAYRLRHGEAVAIGLAVDVLYSELAGHLPVGAAEPVLRLLERLGLPLWDPALAVEREPGRLQVLDGLEEFREHLGGELTITLLRGIGDGFEVHRIDDGLMQRAILRLRHRARAA